MRKSLAWSSRWGQVLGLGLELHVPDSNTAINIIFWIIIITIMLVPPGSKDPGLKTKNKKQAGMALRTSSSAWSKRRQTKMASHNGDKKRLYRARLAST